MTKTPTTTPKLSRTAALRALRPDAVTLKPALSAPSNFRFNEVSSLVNKLGLTPRPIPLPIAPPLGAIAAFAGTWTGSGFNTIFRPQSAATPTPLPVPAPGDNVLELNLTQETLSFSPPLGSVPNRGMVQGDMFLNGVPYLQSINDVTTGAAVGIHFEPGLWLSIPATTNPAEGATLVRMASIPHGTTIAAQGTSRSFSGPPVIPAVDITPFPIGNPAAKIHFPSQTLTNANTARIPQDLTAFNASGRITQAILTDPNTVLRNAIAHQTITATTQIDITTRPVAPLFGGGTANIAFLLGNAGATAPNADAVLMTASFWIETVQHKLTIPIFKAGQPPFLLKGEAGPGAPAPVFSVNPPAPIAARRVITFTTTQIQYSQTVLLNFNGLSWPHVSVATLVPAGTIPVPPSAW